MLTTIEDLIVAKLEGIKDASNKRVFDLVDVWNDDPEEMMKKVVTMPRPE